MGYIYGFITCFEKGTKKNVDFIRLRFRGICKHLTTIYE